jgi:hypothetical protein
MRRRFIACREPAATDFTGEPRRLILQLPHAFDKAASLTSCACAAMIAVLEV